MKSEDRKLFLIFANTEKIFVLLFCFPPHFSFFVILTKQSLREKRHYANFTSSDVLYYITSLGTS